MSEETIEHWTWIVRAVFQAEHNIIDEWKGKLKEAQGDKIKELAIAQEYVRAVAIEILSKSMDYEQDKVEK